MTFDFDLDLEQSRIFVKQFLALLREPGSGLFPSNSSEWFEDGFFVSKHSGSFEINGEKLFVEWLLKFKSDHCLSSISNSNKVDDPEFELKISSFLNRVLQNVS